ncbi:hypothetical protein Tco_0039794 [Tanacetum coccineum]
MASKTTFTQRKLSISRSGYLDALFLLLVFCKVMTDVIPFDCPYHYYSHFEGSPTFASYFPKFFHFWLATSAPSTYEPLISRSNQRLSDVTSPVSYTTRAPNVVSLLSDKTQQSSVASSQSKAFGSQSLNP